MQYQQTPQGLAQIFSDQVPVSAQPAMMGLLGTQQAADTMTQQDQARQLGFDQANDPLKLAHSGLENQTLEGALGGVQARSRMDVRKDSNESATNDQFLSDLKGKYSSAELKRHADDFENIGQTLSQLGATVNQMDPASAHARVKSELTAMGHPDLYDAAMANTDPGALGTKLTDMGGSIVGQAAKYKNAMALAEAKVAGAQQVALTRADAQRDVATTAAEQRKATALALMETKKYVAQVPKGLEMYAAQMLKLADAEPDPKLAAAYRKEAEEAASGKAQINAAGAGVTAGIKPNLPALGIGDNNGAGIPKPGVSMTGAQGVPAAPKAGDVMKGYRFKGGNPADKANWEPQ